MAASGKLAAIHTNASTGATASTHGPFLRVESAGDMQSISTHDTNKRGKQKLVKGRVWLQPQVWHGGYFSELEKGFKRPIRNSSGAQHGKPMTGEVLDIPPIWYNYTRPDGAR